MTGRMPSVHGVRSNGIPLTTDNLTFVDLLSADGYQTALVGKNHLQNFVDLPAVLPQSIKKPGFSTLGSEYSQARTSQLESDDYQYESPLFWQQSKKSFPDSFYGYKHVELVTGHGDTVGGNYRQWLYERNPDADQLMGAENQLPHDYICPQAVRTALPEELYSTTYIAERAEAYIMNQQRAERPFFLKVSFPDPHHPFNPPGKYWDMYRPEDMPVPEAFNRPEWKAPDIVQSIFHAREAGKAMMSGMNTIGINQREAQEARALTCGMITMIDDAVGRILTALTEAGVDNNTIILFTTDHGDHLGDHRLLLKGAEQYLDILRVPFIYYDPSQTTLSKIESVGSTVDIAPTILERAQINPYEGMQGHSLVSTLTDDCGVREFAFVQFDHQRVHPGLGQPPRVRSLVNDQWRISMFAHKNWGELYDLKADPGEFVNLWDDPDYRELKSRLLETLARTEIECVDRIFLPTKLA